jgi:glutaredoxin/glutathione-dependent peroxiredoxin
MPYAAILRNLRNAELRNNPTYDLLHVEISLRANNPSTLSYNSLTMASSFSRSALRAASQFSRLTPIFKPTFTAPLTSRRAFASPASQPRLRLGSEAPNFQAKTTQGDIDFHQWLDNSWAVLFSHPADFTPVCTTELGRFANMRQEFEKRGVKMIGLSANDLGSHGKWIEDINELSKTQLQFPIIADAERKVVST